MSVPPASREQLSRWASQLGLILVNQDQKEDEIQKLNLDILSGLELAELSSCRSLSNARLFAKTALLDICYQHLLSLNR